VIIAVVRVSCTRQFPLEAQRGQAPFPREFISICIIIRIAKKRGFRQSWVIKIRFSCYTDDMPFLPDLLTKMKNQGAALADFFRGLPGKLTSFFAALRERGAFFDGLFPGKRKWLLFGLGAALLFSLVLVLTLMNRKPRSGPPPAEELTGPLQDVRIPREELFLPDEPGFLPGVLPERERREAWTAEDAAPYWQDPLKSGEEPWRDQVESVIDDLLERVP
jgi:hypothetical protein